MENNFGKGMMAGAFIVTAFTGFILGYGSGASYVEETSRIKDKIIKTQYEIIKQQETEISRQEELLLGENTCL